MSCTQPTTAQSYICESTGLKGIRFKNFEGEPNLELPCRKCPSCKLAKAREWALRCWHESQMHEQSCFVTLTYRDKDLPPNYNLDHRDFQLFMKRIRINECKKLSFFMCGEYGDGTHRPHYHVILYGYYPADAKYHRTENKHRYYKSETLDKYWRLGFTDTTNVSYQNAGYIARYTLKKQLPKTETQSRYVYTDSNDEIQTRRFEYIRMSTDPAIGRSWALKYVNNWGHLDYVLDPKGNKCPVPKYYRDMLRDDICLETSEKNSASRIENARTNPDNDPSRLAAKKICAEATLKNLPRPYL